MNYMFLLLEGSKKEKNEFLFKFICKKNSKHFELQNLIDFYKMINRQEFFDKFSELELFEEEEDMAKIVFDMIGVEYNSKISFSQFEKFLEDDPNNVQLFNFLSVDAESHFKKIRVKKNFGNILNMIKNLQADITYLKSIIFPEYQNKKNDFVSSTKKFSLNFQKVLRKKSKKNPIIENFIGSRTIFNSGANLNISDFNPRNSFKTIIDTMETKINHAEADLNKRLIHKVLNLMNKRTINIEEILKKELNIFHQKEKLNDNLKSKLIENNNDNKHKVFMNNPNWSIVTTMITGISKSINIVSSDKYHLLSKYDFKFHNKIELEAVYGHIFKKCKFKDYAPYVFQNIRKQFGISDESYIQSIGINTFRNAFFDKLYLMLSETSTGKSGSFFFHTSDGKFMIKTIKKNEFAKLMEDLSSYFKFLLKNPHTFLPKFYGLHQIKCINDNSVIYDIYIVVMNNVFEMKNPQLIDSKYDLKGSTYKRLTKIKEIQKGAAKKDLNFIKENFKLNFSKEFKEYLMRQFENDADFLARHNIIDYSLLLGVINKKEENNSEKQIVSYLEDNQKGLNYFESSDKKYIYYIGIIDTLTNYGLLKKSEYISKKLFQDSTISCIPPKEYKERFVNFIDNAIEEK
jgi:hypothetical protein